MSSNAPTTNAYVLPKNYSPLDLKSYKAFVMTLPAADRVEHIRGQQAKSKEEHDRVVAAKALSQGTAKASYTKREKLLLKDFGVLGRALCFFEEMASPMAAPPVNTPVENAMEATHLPTTDSAPLAPPGITKSLGETTSSVPRPESKGGMAVPSSVVTSGFWSGKSGASSAAAPPSGLTQSGVPYAPPGLIKPATGATLHLTAASGTLAPPGITKPFVEPTSSVPRPEFKGGATIPSSVVSSGFWLGKSGAPAAATTPPSGVAQSGVPSAPPGLIKPPNVRVSSSRQGSSGGSVEKALGAPPAPLGLTRSSIESNASVAAPPITPASREVSAVATAPLSRAGPAVKPLASLVGGSTIPSTEASQTLLALARSSIATGSVPLQSQPERITSLMDSLYSAQANITRLNKRLSEPIMGSVGSVISTSLPPSPPVRQANPNAGSTTIPEANVPARPPPHASMAPFPSIQPKPSARVGSAPSMSSPNNTWPRESSVAAPAPTQRTTRPQVPVQQKARNTSGPHPGLHARPVQVTVKQEENGHEFGQTLRTGIATHTTSVGGSQAPEKWTTPLVGGPSAGAGTSRPPPRPIPKKVKQVKQELDLHPPLPSKAAPASQTISLPAQDLPIERDTMPGPSGHNSDWGGAATQLPLHLGEDKSVQKPFDPEMKAAIVKDEGVQKPFDPEMRLATVKDEAELNGITKSIQQAAEAPRPNRRKKAAKDGNATAAPSRKAPSKRNVGKLTGAPSTRPEAEGKEGKRKRAREVARSESSHVEGSTTKKRKVVMGEGEGTQDEAESLSESEEDLGKGSRDIVTEWGVQTQYRIIDGTGVPKPLNVRVLKPVGEGDTALAKILGELLSEYLDTTSRDTDARKVQERIALHNHIAGGATIPPKLLIRVRKLRHVLPELGALSRLSILSIFIHLSKLTRCHRHTVSDRASTVNDHTACYDNVRKFAVTGVPLRPSNEVQVPHNLQPEEERRKWWESYKKMYPHRLGISPSPDRMSTEIGGLNEKELLRFFRKIDGKYYLHCGCELEDAIFDFFLWKTMPPLIAPSTQTAECIGNPFDPRTRGIVISLLSSFGFGPHNVDSAFKYNREGKANDLTKAPAFVQNFWKERDAQAQAPVAPEPRLSCVAEYVEVDELNGPPEEDPFGEKEDEEETALPKLTALAEASVSEEEGEINEGEVMDVDDDQVEAAVNVEHTPSFDTDFGQAGIIKEEEVEGGGLLQEGSGIENPPVMVRALRETVEAGRTVFILDDSSDDEHPLYQAEYDEYEGGDEPGRYADEPVVTRNVEGELDAGERALWDSFDSDSVLTDLEDEGGEGGADEAHKRKGDNNVAEHGGDIQ